jgi:hypothetical protein
VFSTDRFFGFKGVHLEPLPVIAQSPFGTFKPPQRVEKKKTKRNRPRTEIALSISFPNPETLATSGAK